MPASDTRICICPALLALSTAACSDHGGPEDLGRAVEASGQGAAGWVLVQTGDVNLDGMADVHWDNPTTKRMAVWLMRGTTLLETGLEIPGPPGNDWKVAYAGDTDADGMADAIWTSSTLNAMAVWTMNGTHVVTPGPWIPGPL